MWRVVLREQGYRTPLILAIEMRAGGEEMVKLLLGAKAEVNLNRVGSAPGKHLVTHNDLDEDRCCSGAAVSSQCPQQPRDPGDVRHCHLFVIGGGGLSSV